VLTKTILLVEDNPDDLALTLRVFEKSRMGYEIHLARDGVEALDYLFGTGIHAGRDLSRMPSIILLDLKLPRRNGFEVLQAVRAFERTRRIPVVILSSSREEKDIARCYDLGANSYIRKPVDFDEFTDVLGQIGSYWLVLNENVAPMH
jgi:two-component system, response regulator